MAGGTAMLVGPSALRIVAATTWLIDDDPAYQCMAARKKTFEDGNAVIRIVESLFARHSNALAQ